MPVTINPVLIKAAALRAAAIRAMAIRAAGIKAAAIAGALQALPGPGASTPGRALGVAALITWVLDAGSGGYMIGTWIRRGGPRALRDAGDRLAPALVFGHFGLASTGLLLWASYIATRAPALAWVAITLLVLVIGLGISTVTLWTPFPGLPAADDPGSGHADGSSLGEAVRDNGGPVAGPARDSLTGGPTDETLERALTDEALLNRLVDDVVASVPADPSAPAAPGRHRTPRVQIMALIPAGHGLAAMATVLLAVLAAATAR
jgi:hypothetical protein